MSDFARLLGAVFLLLAVSVAPGLGADRFTPVLLSTLTPPTPMRGTDGLLYLQYELLLTSHSGAAFRIERIEVLDARTGRVVSDVSGPAVESRVRSFTGARRSLIQPAQTAFALLFPTFATMAEVPRALRHRVTVKPEPARPLLGSRIVLTVARVRDATVVSVLDGLPERVPGQLPADTTLQNVTGNHVVLDLGSGAFAMYAHMQPGSIRVKRGQRVRRGQVLGLLGNSGNTTAPHLHLHLMDSPSPLGSQPVPYVFDRLTVRGKVPAGFTEEEMESGRGTPLETGKRGPQRRVLPMHDWVVDFPPARR